MEALINHIGGIAGPIECVADQCHQNHQNLEVKTCGAPSETRGRSRPRVLYLCGACRSSESVARFVVRAEPPFSF